jgi:heme exporter protein CcmB
MLTHLKFTLKSLLRSPYQLSLPILFYCLIWFLLPFTSSAESGADNGFSSFSMAWVIMILASFMSFPMYFDGDIKSGFTEQMIMHQSTDFFCYVIAKIFAVWLVCILPLAISAIALGILEHPERISSAYVAIMLIASLNFACLGGLAAALAAEGGGTLTGVIIMPFYAPQLIIGANGAMLNESSQFLALNDSVLFSIGLFMLLAPICAFLAATALKRLT